MNHELNSDQISFYRENGYIIIPDFLDPTELETWRAAVGAAVAARDNRVLPDAAMLAGDGGYYDRVFVQRVNLWMDSEAVRSLILDPRIGRMAAELEGIDGVRMWHDQALFKAPWGNPTAWHLDNPPWSFHSRHAISIWIALDDATPENGCMYFLPGTHKIARFECDGIGQNCGALFERYPEFAKFQSVAASMKAGTCSFHNGLTVHGAGANMTPGFRRAMTAGFMPDGSTFNGIRNVLPENYFSRLRPGDVLDNDAQNPLLYRSPRVQE